jgi:hypothetical protein
MLFIFCSGVCSAGSSVYVPLISPSLAEESSGRWGPTAGGTDAFLDAHHLPGFRSVHLLRTEVSGGHSTSVDICSSKITCVHGRGMRHWAPQRNISQNAFRLGDLLMFHSANLRLLDEAEADPKWLTDAGGGGKWAKR